MKSLKSLTDEKLIVLLRDDDEYAYTEIFHRYKEILFRHAYHILENGEEAEDAVQEVFMVLWQKREAIQLHTSLSAYLYRSIRNRVFNMMSRREVALRYASSVLRFIEEARYTTDEQVREKELAQLIERAIDALPPRMREVFLLRREQGLSYPEIGDELGISHKTAKLHVAQATKILKSKIHLFILLSSVF